MAIALIPPTWDTIPIIDSELNKDKKSRAPSQGCMKKSHRSLIKCYPRSGFQSAES